MSFITIILVFLSTTVGIINSLYFLFIFVRLSYFRHKIKEKPQFTNTVIPISVIICAKNEGETLFHSIEAIASQDYPNFEIILVDDHSSDNSLSIMEKLTKYYDFIHFFSAPDQIKDAPGKKAALAYGISKAKNKLLLMTDADCQPASKNWIQLMVNQLQNKEIVLGYGPTSKKPGLINRFFQFETFITAVQYFSYSLANIPYMGVGRNLLYKKSLFEKSNGFKTHLELASGDDDLFIQSVADQHNTSICLKPEAFMYSEGPESFRQFIKQKLRHSSTSYNYSWLHKILLFLFAFSHLSFYIMISFLLIVNLKFALIIYFPFITVRWMILWPIMQKLNENNLKLIFPILDFIFAVYILIMAILSPFANTNQWK